MGVHGLTTYVENHKHLLKDVRFRDSQLVIDGCSLYYRLFFTQGLDQQRGGDYDAFAALLDKFFSALEACNIRPYVVLDGGMDPSDKKFATLRQRMQSKIREADTLCHGRSGSVLPILTRRVFIQFLIQRGVPLVQCPAEADWEIACLAHQWKCPVLTSDSDFYIFDLPGGYLPLQFFHWNHLNGKANQRYISARRYTASGLCQWFGSVHCELLALAAVLIGNDYGCPKSAEKVFAMLNESGFMRGATGKGGASSSRIDGLLLWLLSFRSVTEALEDVSAVMVGQGSGGRRGQQSEMSSKLRIAMQEYSINTQSSLARWFSDDRKAGLGGQTSHLPECLSQLAARGLLAPWVIDALVMHRVFLIPQVENSKLASSHSISQTIRQALYGILLLRPQNSAQLGIGPQDQVQIQDTRSQQNTRQEKRRGGRGRGGRGQGGRGESQISSLQQGADVALGMEQVAGTAAMQTHCLSTPIFVEEYDRLDLNLKINQVQVQPSRNQIHLETLPQAPLAARLGNLFEVLGITESALAHVPLHLHLTVAVTCFWQKKAKPRPSQPQLQALLLCMVYGELSRISKAPHNAPQVNWAAERQVQAKLDQLRVRTRERRGLDISAVHCFSQWQSCLWAVLCLNQLLLLPLPEPNLSCLFSGTLVHGLIRYLKGGRTAESLLVRESLSGRLYSNLLDVVRICSFQPHPSASVSGGRGNRGRGRGQGGRGRGRGGRGARGGRSIDEVTNRFALLMSEEEFDND